MTAVKAFGLQALLLAIAFTIFFLVFGERGGSLIFLVVVLSLFLPFVYWLRNRQSQHK